MHISRSEAIKEMSEKENEIKEIEWFEFDIGNNHYKETTLNKLKLNSAKFKNNYIKFNDVEPFKIWIGKDCFAVGHSLDCLYYGPNDSWYLETKSYVGFKIKGKTLICNRNIFRFIFTGDLPKEIKKLLPDSAIQLAKKGMLCTENTIELPAMGGKVITLTYDGDTYYYVKNPKIFKIKNKSQKGVVGDESL